MNQSNIESNMNENVNIFIFFNTYKIIFHNLDLLSRKN